MPDALQALKHHMTEADPRSTATNELVDMPDARPQQQRFKRCFSPQQSQYLYDPVLLTIGSTVRDNC